MSVCLAQPSEWDRKGSTSAIRGVENYSKDAPTTLSALLSPALGIASVDPPPRHPPPVPAISLTSKPVRTVDWKFTRTLVGNV